MLAAEVEIIFPLCPEWNIAFVSPNSVPVTIYLGGETRININRTQQPIARNT
jgi:hypothetical protein